MSVRYECHQLYCAFCEGKHRWRECPQKGFCKECGAIHPTTMHHGMAKENCLKKLGGCGKDGHLTTQCPHSIKITGYELCPYNEDPLTCFRNQEQAIRTVPVQNNNVVVNNDNSHFIEQITGNVNANWSKEDITALIKFALDDTQTKDMGALRKLLESKQPSSYVEIGWSNQDWINNRCMLRNTFKRNENLPGSYHVQVGDAIHLNLTGFPRPVWNIWTGKNSNKMTGNQRYFDNFLGNLIGKKLSRYYQDPDKQQLDLIKLPQREVPVPNNFVSPYSRQLRIKHYLESTEGQQNGRDITFSCIHSALRLFESKGMRLPVNDNYDLKDFEKLVYKETVQESISIREEYYSEAELMQDEMIVIKLFDKRYISTFELHDHLYTMNWKRLQLKLPLWTHGAIRRFLLTGKREICYYLRERTSPGTLYRLSEVFPDKDYDMFTTMLPIYCYLGLYKPRYAFFDDQTPTTVKIHQDFGPYTFLEPVLSYLGKLSHTTFWPMHTPGNDHEKTAKIALLARLQHEPVTHYDEYTNKYSTGNVDSDKILYVTEKPVK